VSTGAEPVALRAMTAADVPGGLRLSHEAGWNQRDEDWRFLVARNRGRFVAALRDGRVVGTGGAAVYGTALAWVCMILVDPAERGRGLGTRIVEAVLDRVRDVAIVGLDATPRGLGVYARLGFVEEARLVRMELPAASAGNAARVAQGAAGASGVRAMTRADLEAVLALDREAFGADRAAVLRWEFEGGPAWLAEGRDGLAGYCFRRAGRRFSHMGPLVARDVDAARRLLGAALAEARDAGAIVDVPAASAWLSALTKRGFREQRPLIRMYRGGAQPPGRPDLQLAILGPEFG